MSSKTVAPAAAPAARLQKRAERAAVAPLDESAEPPRQGAEKKAENAVGGAAMSAPAVRSAAPVAQGSMLRDEADQRPEVWLARVRALRDAGDVPAARRELDAFVRANPERQIPEDLQALLRPEPPPAP